MFILRPAQMTDLEDLYELSQLVLFINLPADKPTIRKKIEKSLQTFSKPSPKKENNYYLFVLEDFENNRVIGVSQIHGQHGTESEPHYYLKVGSEKRFSKTLNTGFIHGTLELDFEPNGHTEIGALVLDPKYRGHKDKLGKQLSFVRFLYMGMNPHHFTPEVHTELMPPFNTKGESPLWEAVGRKFLNMDYHEADVLSRKNKEFILSLFPSSTIYVSLLPLEARDAIGKVGEDTLPVKKMLENIGFHYVNEVDPFDGGPHYRAPLKEIKPIKELQTIKIKWVKKPQDYGPISSYLMELKNNEKDFLAFKVEGFVEKNTLYLEKRNLEELCYEYDLSEKEEYTIIPLQ